MSRILLLLLLLPFQASADCPGLKLAESCGNLKCEASLGETPENCPVDCSTAEIHSYNLQTVCPEVTRVLVPESIEAAASFLKSAAAAGQSVRIVGKRHSVTSQLCAQGPVLVTEKLKRVIGLEVVDGVPTVAVEGGITFGELNEWLNERGLALGYAVPVYRGISVAGALSTGSHGDSLTHTAVVSAAAQAITVILPSGEVRDLKKGANPGDEFRAAAASLGMLGLIARVNLPVREQFAIHMRVLRSDDKFLMKAGGIEKQLAACDNVRVHWFPNRNRTFTFCGSEAPGRAMDPGADNKALYPDSGLEEVATLRKRLQEGACSGIVNGALELVNRLAMRFSPPFFKLDSKGTKLVSASDVTGPSHRILTSDTSTYVSSLPNVDYSITIPITKAHEAIRDFAALAKAKHLFFPMNGVALRFMPSEEASFLADSAAGGAFVKGRPTVNFEFNVFRPVGFDAAQMKSWLAPYEELARMLIHDYSGRAHWGKNNEELFVYEREQNAFGDLFTRFASVRAAFDPKGVFKNRFAVLVGF